jgi:hypothetical protein
MNAANLETLRQKLEADGYRLVPADNPIEWGRLPDMRRCFGIKRSTAYLLINEGKIRSKLVRLAHSRTGTRLIDFASVRDFLNGSPERPTAEISKAVIKNGTLTKDRRRRSTAAAATQKPSGEKRHRQREAGRQREPAHYSAIKLVRRRVGGEHFIGVGDVADDDFLCRMAAQRLSFWKERATLNA